jgi:hypothetical protein
MEYLLESSFCLTLFYGLYLLIFSRFTFVRLNRLYLLASLVLSLGIPLLSVQIPEVVWIDAAILANSEDAGTPLLLTKTVAHSQAVVPKPQPFDWSIALWFFYGVGVIFLWVRLFVFVVKILKMRNLKTEHDYIPASGRLANSSFFNLIFIDDSTLSPYEIEQIVAHERWHVRLYHSIDLLFVEALKIIFWFNPALWFLQKSLAQLHEYEVDTRMIQRYDRQVYAQLLLKLAHTTPRFSPMNLLSRKPLSDRIHFMFTKTKTMPMKRFIYLSVLPLLGGMLMAFSLEKVVTYQVQEPPPKYFIINKKSDRKVVPEVSVKDNKPISSLTYGPNKVSLAMAPDKITGKEFEVAAQYFKQIGFNLTVVPIGNRNKQNYLDGIELALVEDSGNKQKYRAKKKDVKSDLPAKFRFNLAEMRGNGKQWSTVFTLFADRTTGEHFVAPLYPPPPPPPPVAPPPPPPVEPPSPPSPPTPIKPPKKGTKLSMSRSVSVLNLT